MSTPRDMGVLALVDIGTTIYHKDRAIDPDVLPRGGMVVDTERVPIGDEDGIVTGYVRRFVTVDPYTLTERHIDEADVDLEAIEPPYSANMVKLLRRLVLPIATTQLVGPSGKRPGKYQARAGSEFTVIDARRLDHAYRLRGALMPRSP